MDNNCKNLSVTTVNKASELINPLDEALSLEQAVEPCTMVIFGAHGDLTKRKLIPALYSLYSQRLLPDSFCVIGLSRTQMNHDEFRLSMCQAMHEFADDVPIDKDTLAQFANCLYYLPTNFGDNKAFSALSLLIDELKVKHQTRGNNIFYLSTPPSLYIQIVRQLALASLAGTKSGKKTPWPRIIVEKPFGRDLASARLLNQELHQVFAEHQIFRIDHYLGKETVQNIMVLRFANGIFEPLWNRQHIEHVQITNAETIGVEGRGAYYEEAGNLRDVVQNHMLQLVSIIAMEPPVSLDSEDTRDERSKVLKSIRPFDLTKLDQYIVRGQYGPGCIGGQKVPGYRDERNVSAESQTETFSALRLYIDNWRWADVPFYVRSGKRLAKAITEIAIHFRRAPHRLFHNTREGEALDPNVLVLQIQPDEGISLKFATKQPGPTTHLRWLSMDFAYDTAFGTTTPSAYERLLHDCIMGDASLFARTDAVEQAWELITPVLEAWAAGPRLDFPNYSAGSWGPQASDNLIAGDLNAWRHL
ncbi:MAG: glucose-6-phosphate dehydrogenase [Candidatus Melainabacteria bacterium]|nr:glucose-6-phosphate dehydrogenase [Candidatus Melainabacteria bacterium]